MRPAILLLFISALTTYASSPVAGRWEGSVQIPGNGVNLILDLDQPDGKEWIGSVIIPGLGVTGAPLSELVMNDAAISGTIKGALTGPRTGNTTLKASLTNDGQLNGEMLAA